MAQILDRGENPIPDFVFDHVPELFTGVEFRPVGRQVDDPHPRRQTGIAVAEMEPRLVANEDVDGIGVCRFKIFQVESIPTLVDARDLAKVGVATDHIKRAVEVIPLLLDLPGHHGTLPFAGPQPPQLGMQPKTRLIPSSKA